MMAKMEETDEEGTRQFSVRSVRDRRSTRRASIEGDPLRRQMLATMELRGNQSLRSDSTLSAGGNQTNDSSIDVSPDGESWRLWTSNQIP
jgi:hypothetical protein